MNRILKFLAAQPEPLWVSTIVIESKRSSLVRGWKDGDPERCRLCPPGSCIAKDNVCHLVVPSAVPEGEAALFSSVHLPRKVGR